MTMLVIPPHEGQAISLDGLGAIFKISGDSSEGRFSIVEHPIDPGRMVHPHVHAHEDEFSYVLEGEIGARIGDEALQATTGSYVFKPRGLPHTFRNATTRPARLLELISPAGFEKYFAELADCCTRAAMSDQITNLAKKYGMELRMDWVPELCAKYKLKLVGE
jgi:quercetin dioxygenase-like cupin family protein